MFWRARHDREPAQQRGHGAGFGHRPYWGNVGEMRLGLEIDPLPFVPGPEDGLVVPTQMVDAGVALRVAF